MMMTKKITTYTGIGSRKTPREIQELMTRFASVMARHGAILRSGAAKGADAAFERGCDAENGQKQIFLPWRSFNDHPSTFYDPSDKCFDIASKIHPNWKACQQAAQKLHARNCHQVLGPNLDDPSDMVIYWAIYNSDGEIEGGTRTAVKLAEERDIMLINLYQEDKVKIIEDIINEYEAS